MYRFEKKYVINRSDIVLLNHRLRSIMSLDRYTDINGNYNVRSLYFDDRHDTSLFQVIDGISERDKYRIRIYNSDSTGIYLEKKHKRNNMTLKTSCLVTKEQYNMILGRGSCVIDSENHKLLNEVLIKKMVCGLRPSIIVDYHRTPFVYTSGNVRITIDDSLQCGNCYMDFFSDNQNFLPIMDKGLALLEVKYNNFIPDFIRFALQLNQLERTSYSKYLMGRELLRNVGRNYEFQ